MSAAGVSIASGSSTSLADLVSHGVGAMGARGGAEAPQRDAKGRNRPKAQQTSQHRRSQLAHSLARSRSRSPARLLAQVIDCSHEAEGPGP